MDANRDTAQGGEYEGSWHTPAPAAAAAAIVLAAFASPYNLPVLRMRLRRTGAKKQPRYRVVIAEARTPRDGAFIDSIGFYDPLTEPSTIKIDRDKALGWLSKGAQPSDTVVRLLQRAGIAPADGPLKEGAPDGGGTDSG